MVFATSKEYVHRSNIWRIRPAIYDVLFVHRVYVASVVWAVCVHDVDCHAVPLYLFASAVKLRAAMPYYHRPANCLLPAGTPQGKRHHRRPSSKAILFSLFRHATRLEPARKSIPLLFLFRFALRCYHSFCMQAPPSSTSDCYRAAVAAHLYLYSNNDNDIFLENIQAGFSLSLRT